MYDLSSIYNRSCVLPGGIRTTLGGRKIVPQSKETYIWYNDMNPGFVLGFTPSWNVRSDDESVEA